MQEFRAASHEFLIQKDIEIEHGKRMIQFYEKKMGEVSAEAEKMDKKERYDFEKKELKPIQNMIAMVGKEVAAKEDDAYNRRVAVAILEGMMQEEEEDLLLKAQSESEDIEKVEEAKKDFETQEK